MVLLAALDVVVHRYVGVDDVVIGTAIANRNRLESEDLVGVFLNTLVMRTDLAGNPTFGEVLERVRGVALDATTNQDVPFATLVSELQPVRDLSRSPLFQVFLNVLNTPFERPQFDALTTESLDVDRGAAQFDLAVWVDLVGQPDRLLRVQHRSVRRVDRPTGSSTICGPSWRRWCGSPSTPVGLVELLPVGERAVVVEGWNDTGGPFERGGPGA